MSYELDITNEKLKTGKFPDYTKAEERDDEIIVSISSSKKNDEIFEIIKDIRLNLKIDKRIVIQGNLQFSSETFTFEIDCSNCIFEKEVVFQNCVFQKKIAFEGSIFQKDTNFEKSKFHEDVNFENSTFHEDVNFKRTIFGNTSMPENKSQISFKEAFFERKVRFHRAKFKTSICFENTVFNDLIDFYLASFQKAQQFWLTDFLGVTIFSNVEFNDQVQFLYNKVSANSIISFEGAIFKKSLDLSRANFWCKLNFWNIKIDNIYPKARYLYGTDSVVLLNENLFTDDEKNAQERLRETYRIIKNEFSKESNIVESSKYLQYEMSIYEKEKKQDKFLLFLNKYSNNFGYSWIRGILFTITISLLFYLGFLYAITNCNLCLDLSYVSFTQTIRYWLEFMNITNWNIKPFGIEYSNEGYIILFIGRLFISYGYYQTIQAFRKYGKK